MGNYDKIFVPPHSGKPHPVSLQVQRPEEQKYDGFLPQRDNGMPSPALPPPSRPPQPFPTENGPYREPSSIRPESPQQHPQDYWNNGQSTGRPARRDPDQSIRDPGKAIGAASTSNTGYSKDIPDGYPKGYIQQPDLAHNPITMAYQPGPQPTPEYRPPVPPKRDMEVPKPTPASPDRYLRGSNTSQENPEQNTAPLDSVTPEHEVPQVQRSNPDSNPYLFPSTIATAAFESARTATTTLHTANHLAFPILFFAVFGITFTVLIIYTLALHKPMPVKFLEGVGGVFLILLTGWLCCVIAVKCRKMAATRRMMSDKRAILTAQIAALKRIKALEEGKGAGEGPRDPDIGEGKKETSKRGWLRLKDKIKNLGAGRHARKRQERTEQLIEQLCNEIMARTTGEGRVGNRFIKKMSTSDSRTAKGHETEIKSMLGVAVGSLETPRMATVAKDPTVACENAAAGSSQHMHRAEGLDGYASAPREHPIKQGPPPASRTPRTRGRKIVGSPARPKQGLSLIREESATQAYWGATDGSPTEAPGFGSMSQQYMPAYPVCAPPRFVSEGSHDTSSMTKPDVSTSSSTPRQRESMSRYHTPQPPSIPGRTSSIGKGVFGQDQPSTEPTQQCKSSRTPQYTFQFSQLSRVYHPPSSSVTHAVAIPETFTKDYERESALVKPLYITPKTAKHLPLVLSHTQSIRNPKIFAEPNGEFTIIDSSDDEDLFEAQDPYEPDAEDVFASKPINGVQIEDFGLKEQETETSDHGAEIQEVDENSVEEQRPDSLTFAPEHLYTSFTHPHKLPPPTHHSSSSISTSHDSPPQSSTFSAVSPRSSVSSQESIRTILEKEVPGIIADMERKRKDLKCKQTCRVETPEAIALVQEQKAELYRINSKIERGSFDPFKRIEDLGIEKGKVHEVGKISLVGDGGGKTTTDIDLSTLGHDEGKLMSVLETAMGRYKRKQEGKDKNLNIEMSNLEVADFKTMAAKDRMEVRNGEEGQRFWVAEHSK